jgi:hypothetical protein
MDTLEYKDSPARPATTPPKARQNYHDFARKEHAPAPVRYEDMTEAERRDLAARLVAARQRLARQGVL